MWFKKNKRFDDLEFRVSSIEERIITLQKLLDHMASNMVSNVDIDVNSVYDNFAQKLPKADISSMKERLKLEEKARLEEGLT